MLAFQILKGDLLNIDNRIETKKYNSEFIMESNNLSKSFKGLIQSDNHLWLKTVQSPNDHFLSNVYIKNGLAAIL